MKQIKLLLINTIDPGLVPTFDSPLHLAALATYLIRKHILNKSSIKIISSDYDDVMEIIENFKPDIIGMSVLTPYYIYATKLAKKIKRKTWAKIILGGPHISGHPRGLSWPFDIGVIGEGEQTFAELVKYFKKYGNGLKTAKLKLIRGIVFMNKDTHLITNHRPLLRTKDIDSIDYSLLPKERVIHYINIVRDNKPVVVKSISIYTARGCPYHCSFCAYQVIWKNKSGLRFFNTKKVVNNIIGLRQKYHINAVNILDDTFAVTKERLRDLIGEFKKKRLLGKIYFNTVMIRANLIDQEFIELLKELGISSVFLGIESGSQRILNYLKNESLTIEQVKNGTKLLADYHINVVGSFMLFSPDENKADLQKTLDLARWFSKQKNVIKMAFGVTTPFPGTKLWDLAVKKKYISTPNINWDRFVITNKNLIKPFFPTPLTKSQQKILWDKFQQLTVNIEKRVNMNVACRKYNKITDKKNSELHARYISKANMKRRIQHLKLNPLKIFIKYFKNPGKIKLFINDLLSILRKVDY